MWGLTDLIALPQVALDVLAWRGRPAGEATCDGCSSVQSSHTGRGAGAGWLTRADC